MFARLQQLLQIGHAHRITRRYFVTNGFDGALTMLGLCMGFYASGEASLGVMISACLGAAIALSVSGLSSAYVSETTERRKELKDLERALVHDLEGTTHDAAARLLPWLIAAVNGLAPLLIALFIISPLWLALAGVALPLPPLELCIGLAFLSLFLLGVFLGHIGGQFWLWAGIRTLFVALLTSGIIYLVSV